ncbi:MAG: MBL fold metallo-hydrolase [Planctomycetes bacterium]|nr:MBL fold metallo-hydrolase [Planctomycetota bacterium]
MSWTLTFLGTGTSAGVPLIGCDCAVCHSSDPRDRRDRPSVLVKRDNKLILIDTTPDLRHQMLRHKVHRLDAVLYTHNHADHVFGIDDLRRFNAVMDAPLDIFAEQYVIDWLRETFRYMFDPKHNPNRSFVPQLILHPVIPGEAVSIAHENITPLRILHGRLPILGYRLGAMAYCTDCSAIAPETWRHLDDLDVLVIDGLRYTHHPTHMTVDQALAVIEQVKPKRAYLTHIAHEISHADLEPRLPEHVRLAYDDLKVELDD